MAMERTSVSAYLLRAGVRSELEHKFQTRTPLVNGLSGWFHALEADSREPAWLRALLPHLGSVTTSHIRSKAPGGIALVERGNLNFVLTFGHAWMALESFWIEPDFGRRVALNAIPPSKVLELNSEQVFARWHVSSERSPRATSFEAFGVALDRDLVAALEGVPSDPLFGGIVRGSTSLRMKIYFQSLNAVLDKAATLFASDDYKRRWPEIDNLTPVEEASEIAALNHSLDAHFRSGELEKSAVLFAPSFRRGDAESASHFIFGRISKNPWIAPYLQYSFWKQHLADKKKVPSLKTATETKVDMLDTDGDSFECRSVFDCLGYELAKNSVQHVLSSGIWYRAETRFIKGVQKVIDALGTTDIKLPAWDEKAHEEAYNASCCTASNGMLLFDKKIVHYGGGQSKFEFCDFMHLKKRTLFFAKIPSRSSDCSHLVEQTKRTIELFFGVDGTFRSKLRKSILKKNAKADTSWLDSRPRPGDWKLCLVLMGKEKDSLPLFARCSVSRLAKHCEERGHPLLLASV